MIQNGDLSLNAQSTDKIFRDTLNNQSLFQNKNFLETLNVCTKIDSPEELEHAKESLKKGVTNDTWKVVEELFSGQNKEIINNRIRWHYEQWKGGKETESEVFDITGFLPVSSLRNGVISPAFPSPKGKWGKAEYLRVGYDLKRVKLRIYNQNGELKLEFISFKGMEKSFREHLRSYFVWNPLEGIFIHYTPKKEEDPLLIIQEKSLKVLKELTPEPSAENREMIQSKIQWNYEQWKGGKETKSEVFDITELLSVSSLKNGLISPAFPTPKGKWGKSEHLRLGNDLKRVKLRIYNQNNKLKLEFIGYKGEKTKLHEYLRSYFEWKPVKGEFIHFIPKKEELLIMDKDAVQKESAESLKKDSVTDHSSINQLSHASSLLGIQDFRILESLLMDNEFSDRLRSAFLKFFIKDGKISMMELQELVQNIEKVKQVKEYFKDIVPEDSEKEAIMIISVYLCLMDQEIKDMINKIHIKQLLKQAA